MNIVCDKVLLSAAIDGVSKAVTMRSAIPVLEGILLLSLIHISEPTRP